MSIPSYNKFVNTPGFDRFQHTNSYFDYFSPGIHFGNKTISRRDSYIIRDDYILTLQLSEMFNRDLPDIMFNGTYISKGVVNVNKQRMYEHICKLDKNFFVPTPNDANRYVGDVRVINYIVRLFHRNLFNFTNGSGSILGYRFRYTFPSECALYPVKTVINTLYKNLKDRIICYSYNINPNGSDAIDIIVSNAPYRKLNTFKSKTLSSYMNYTTTKIDGDLEYAITYNSIFDRHM